MAWQDVSNLLRNYVVIKRVAGGRDKADEAEAAAEAQEPEAPHPWNRLVEQVFSSIKENVSGEAVVFFSISV